jgi:hypothetical protein
LSGGWQPSEDRSLSRNRLKHEEERLYLLGLILKDSIASVQGDELPETVQHWEWLVNLMEVTGRADPVTAAIVPFIRQLIPDPRTP